MRIKFKTVKLTDPQIRALRSLFYSEVKGWATPNQYTGRWGDKRSMKALIARGLVSESNGHHLTEEGWAYCQLHLAQRTNIGKYSHLRKPKSQLQQWQADGVKVASQYAFWAWMAMRLHEVAIIKWDEGGLPIHKVNSDLAGFYEGLCVLLDEERLN